MKKIILITLVAALSLSVIGCSKDNESDKNVLDTLTSETSTVTTVETTDQISGEQQDKYINLAKELSEGMTKGDFTTTFSKFSETLKASVPEDTLKSAWEATVSSIGEYVSYYDTNISEKDGYYITTSILEYEKSGLTVLMAFNANDEIDNILLNYYSIPEDALSNDIFEETSIKIGEYELDGMLTLPKNVENPPVVILVHGSGSSDMNETVNQNKPFKDIAHGLAEKGIASIRYNKRFYQFPTKADADITVSDEVLDDARSAIEFAKSSGKINNSKIIIVGHSLGGMLAPKIALENSDVSGIVSLAGSPRGLEDIMFDQNVDILNTLGLSDADYAAQIEIVQQEINKVKDATPDSNDVIMGAYSKYWYSLNQIDTPEIVKELKIPMLILQGDADFQVYADKDYVLWQEILKDNNAQFKLYENLNHLFMQTNGKSDITEYDTPSNVDKNVINDIADWILAIK